MKIFSKKGRIVIIAVLMFVIALLLGLVFNNGTDENGYLTAEVSRGDIENNITAVGVIQPSSFVDVGAQLSGQLKRLYYKVGDKVKSRTLLAEIDATVYSAKVDELKASLDNLKAQLKMREAQLYLSEQQNARNQALFGKALLSEAEMQVSQTDYKTAAAQVDAIKAQIQEAEGSLRTAKANLAYTKISAPVSGEIVSMSVTEGQTLNANQQTPIILRIANMDTMTVWAQVSEADVQQLKQGQEAYFTTLGSSSRWYGNLKQILPTPLVVNGVILYNALFNVPNQNGDLKIQMTAQVFFVIDKAENILYIPKSALQYSKNTLQKKIQGNQSGQTKTNSSNKTLVYILNDNGTVEEREIVTGISNSIYASVTSGLTEGEKIITGNNTQTNQQTSSGLGNNKGKKK